MPTQKTKKRKRGNHGDGTAAGIKDGVTIDNIGWNRVKLSETFLMADKEDKGGFFYSLEEVDDVDVEIVKDHGGGQMLKFKKLKTNDKKAKAKKGVEKIEEEESGEREGGDSDGDTDSVDLDPTTFVHVDDFVEGAQPKIGGGDMADEEEWSTEDEGDEEEMEEAEDNLEVTEATEGTRAAGDGFGAEWVEMGLSASLLKGLKDQGFSSPTPIQSNVIPKALSGSDILGAAETGSGKTLAFGLPVLQSIVHSEGGKKSKTDQGLHALILTPTRELAMQIAEHLTTVSKHTNVRIVCAVGGMAIQKQRRLLKTRPDIVVATPGRLWELLAEDEEQLNRLRKIRFLVLDEADRMLESGHFKDLEQIFKALSLHRRQIGEVEAEHLDGIKVLDSNVNRNRQTLVFSATLAAENVQGSKGKSEASATMKDLLSKVGFARKPEVVNILPAGKIASGLTEGRIDCLAEDKDVMLYYILLAYPGKTLVFVNSIDSIRRLVPLLKLLKLPVMGLHAQLQQRQRLKALDRLKENPRAVLITSDVAARGLDIPAVEQVIHFQIPRTSDIYIHRSGRTARAKSEGISIALVSPAEVTAYKELCRSLQRKGIDAFPVDHMAVSKLRKRVALARRIEEMMHRMEKEDHDKSWAKKMATDAGLDDDEDDVGGKKPQKKKGDPSENSGLTKKEKKAIEVSVRGWKAELDSELEKPVLPKGFSSRYVSAGVHNAGSMAGVGVDVQSALLANWEEEKRTGQKNVLPSRLAGESSAVDVMKKAKKSRK
ncbi:P-loop containing nucleoside triphosphate hydrolase protein [Cladochytrium replicatum]|nr:P-loop containing nucleoside triphosphate hydrolase protein [Cladochytrium replicatum]